jgi:hypothetical protein
VSAGGRLMRTMFIAVLVVVVVGLTYVITIGVIHQ